MSFKEIKQKFRKNDFLKHIAFGSIFLIYVILLQVTKIYSPFAFITGVPMPTTGITRALLTFVRGDIALAFKMHPLFPLAPFFGLSVYFYLFYKKKKYLVSSIVFSIIFLIVYIIRMVNGTMYF